MFIIPTSQRRKGRERVKERGLSFHLQSRGICLPAWRRFVPPDVLFSEATWSVRAGEKVRASERVLRTGWHRAASWLPSD